MLLESEAYDIRLSTLYKLDNSLNVCPKCLIECYYSKCTNKNITTI